MRAWACTAAALLLLVVGAAAAEDATHPVIIAQGWVLSGHSLDHPAGFASCRVTETHAYLVSGVLTSGAAQSLPSSACLKKPCCACKTFPELVRVSHGAAAALRRGTSHRGLCPGAQAACWSSQHHVWLSLDACRGSTCILPDETLEAFQSAIDDGATFISMHVVGASTAGTRMRPAWGASTKKRCGRVRKISVLVHCELH